MLISIFLSFFVTSVVGLLVMLWYRIWEIETKRVRTSSQNTPLFSVDVLYSKFLVNLHKYVEKIHKWYRVLVVTLHYHGKQITTKVLEKAKKHKVGYHISRVVDKVKGKRYISKSDKLSPYFKKIIEHKNKTRSENNTKPTEE